MKIKLLGLSLALLMCSGGLMAQKNVIKVKPLRPVVSAIGGAPITLPLSYERVIIPRLSAQINFSYQLKGELNPPSAFDISELGFGTPTISTWGFGPEVRFYPNITKDTPRGFYVQGFLNYAKSSISSDFNYKTDLELGVAVVPYEVALQAEGYLNRLNYGVGIGSQWLIASKLCIDILWIGAGWGSGNVGFDINGPLIDVAQVNNELASQGLPAISAGAAGLPTWGGLVGKFDEDLQGLDIPVLNPELTTTTTANSANINIATNLPTLRLFNFSIGFSF